MRQDYQMDVYPNGWFKVAFSTDVKGNKIFSATCFGKDVIVFRDDAGKAHVMDAYCPHLGANLAYGGKVCGGTVRCPFHGWTFDTTGKVVEIPGTDKIEKRKGLQTYESVEHDGAIYIWHDRDDRAPFYNIAELVQPHDPKEWVGPTYVKRNLNIHIQETIDNLVDKAHLCIIHKTMKSCTDYQLTELNEHQMDLKFGVTLNFLGFKKFSPFNTIVTGIGHSRVRVSSVIEFDVVSVPTPVDEELTAFDLMVYIRRSKIPFVNFFFKHYIRYEVINDTKEEMEIIHRKNFLHKPDYSAADGPIAKLRNWAKRFYVNGMNDANDKLIMKAKAS